MRTEIHRLGSLVASLWNDTWVALQLLRSGHFDSDYYLRHSPDVAAAGVSPALHYVRHGVSEGRQPSARFDTRYYLASNADVAASGINPLLHFIRHGAAEGRSPLPPAEPTTRPSSGASAT